MIDEDTLNWDALRAQSLRPGGFGKERTRVWCAELQQCSLVSLSCFTHLILTGLPCSESAFRQNLLRMQRSLQNPLQMTRPILKSVKYVWIPTGAL